MRKWRGILIVVSFIFCTVSVSGEELLKPGENAPSFSLPKLRGNRAVLNVWCGKKLRKPYINNKKHTVILSFWATYCAPCMKEIPELIKFEKENKDKNIKIFLINIDNNRSKVASLVKEKNFDLPVLLDSYKRTAERYGVKSLPSLFVIDPNGIIRYSSKGYDKNKSFTKTLETAVEAAQKGLNAIIEDAGATDSSEYVDAKTSPESLSAQQRWEAVIRVECGEKPVDVAEDIGVEVKTLREWYSVIKKAVKNIWDKE